MTPEQEQFLNDCPAWARKEGIDSLAEWQLCMSLASFDWPTRHDKLDALKAKIVQVLDYWDAMGENHDN